MLTLSLKVDLSLHRSLEYCNTLFCLLHGSKLDVCKQQHMIGFLSTFCNCTLPSYASKIWQYRAPL